MKITAAILIVLALTAIFFGCTQERENVPETDGEAAEAAENVTADVGELASSLDEVDRLLG